MADETVIIEVNYDTEAAVKSVDNLTSSIEGQKVAQAGLKEQLDQGKISQKEYATQLEQSKTTTSKLNSERKSTINLLQSEKGSINEVKANIAKLTKERDKLNTSTKAGKEAAQQYNARINQMKKSLKGAQTQTKQTGGAFAKLGRDLNAIPGPIGGIIKGIQGFTKAGLAFIATPIGAILAAIALAVMAVRHAFKASEEGQNKYAKLMSVINAIVGNFGDLIADLGEKIIAAFENPQKAIKDFAELIKKNIVNRFNGLIELIPQLGKALNQLFKGQFQEAGKTALNAVVKVSLGVDNLTGKLEKAINKTRELIAENIREANEAARVADMRAKADILERKLIVKRAELESQIAELRLKAREEDQFTAEQRKQFLIEARELQDELLGEEKKVLELRRDAQKLENTFSRTNKENKLKEAEAVAAVSRKEAERFNQARQIQRELIRVDAQIERDRKKAEAERKKDEKDILKRRGEAIFKLAEIKQKELELEAKTAQEKRDLLISAANKELEKTLKNKALLDEEIELAEVEHKRRLLEIERVFQEEMSLMRNMALQESLHNFQQIIDASAEMSDFRITIASDTFARLATINFKEVESAAQAFMQIGRAAQGLTSLLTAGHAAEFEDFQSSKDAELAAAGDNIERRKHIEREYNNKEVELKKQQFKDRKAAAIIDASIATALAVVNGLTTQPFVPLGLAMSILAGVLGGVQIAGIAGQPEPKFTANTVFAKGGVVDGPSHSQGGVKFFGQDGSNFEVEGGEAMFVLKKDATAEIAALSMINESHGGRSFTKGNSKHLQDGGEVDTSGVENSVNNAVQQAPIVVKVDDILTGMTNVDNVREAGVI